MEDTNIEAKLVLPMEGNSTGRDLWLLMTGLSVGIVSSTGLLFYLYAADHKDALHRAYFGMVMAFVTIVSTILGSKIAEYLILHTERNTVYE